MRVRDLHPWDLGPAEARQLQDRLRRRVRLEPLPRRLRLVAGADCAFTPDRAGAVAVVALFELPALRLVDGAEGRAPVAFPYVPGLLSFREAPALLAAFRALPAVPDAVIFDGQGIAHPRRLGLASHLGLWLDLPAVGCAKSRLLGATRGAPGLRRGCYRALSDRGEVVGRLVRTRDGVKPLWVSPGHRCDVPGAMELVLRCAVRHRLPEPVRAADSEAGRRSRVPGGAGSAPRGSPERRSSP